MEAVIVRFVSLRSHCFAFLAAYGSATPDPNFDWISGCRQDPRVIPAAPVCYWHTWCGSTLECPHTPGYPGSLGVNSTRSTYLEPKVLLPTFRPLPVRHVARGSWRWWRVVWRCPGSATGDSTLSSAPWWGMRSGLRGHQ